MPRFPFPEDDGGKISMAADLKIFAKEGHKVTAAIISDEIIAEEHIRECEKYCDLHFINYSSKNTPQRIAKSVLKRSSLYTSKHINGYLKEKLVEIIADKEFDVIHCEHTAMAPLGLFAGEITGAKVGIRLQNVEYKIWHRYSEDLPAYHPKSLYVASQAKKLKRDEGRLCEQADISFAITDIDKAAAEEIAPKAKIVTATAGIFPDKIRINDDVLRNPKELIIATTYRWVHNITGLEWFFENVLPELNKQIKGIRVSIIGKNPPKSFFKYEDQGVRMLGYLPEVVPYLNKAGIYIAPLFTGSGIRIKILEAMAAKLPVVATKVSAEGIKAGAKDGLFVSDKADDWVKAIVKLCSNPELQQQAGQAARKKIESEYTWETNVKIMLDEYAKLI
jgi:glycosyltransferase involved in cell wall biosynthesis